MKKTNQEKYLRLVEDKLVEARRRLEILDEDRLNSPSAMESQHDTTRETLEREMGAQENVIKGLEQFKDFIAKNGEKSKIEEGAEFLVVMEGGNEKMNAVYAPISVGLESIRIITPKSPLGAALLDKKAGDCFSYKVGDTMILGRVEEVS